ncbi:MMPL family transporter [Actinomycetaceae bacterium L2_0104]
MFTALGRFTTRRAWVVIGTWILVLVAAIAAALSGFGNGGLFDRMETSEYKIPDTDSSKVMELTEGEGAAGSAGILVVTGVELDDPRVAEFANGHRDLLDGPHVESVVDSFAVGQMREEADQETSAQIEEEISSQVETAMEPIRSQAAAAADDAKAQIQAQVDAAAAMGPEAQAAAQVEADAALAEVDAQTQASLEEAEAQVTAEVSEAVEAAAAEAAASEEAVAAREESENLEASLLSQEGDGYAVVVTREDLSDRDETKESRAELDRGIADYQEALEEEFPGATVTEMSNDSIGDAINAQIQQDLVKGEAFGLPVAAVLMLIVFGGAIAAGLPLIGAISAIAAGMGVLWVSTWVTTIDAFILNVVSIIGLSLSIDYGLLVVSRFREEGAERLRRLPESERPETVADIKKQIVIPSVRKTVSSAGRTVVFSAVTIALALGGIFLIDVHMLQTIAWGGIVVAILAVLAAVTIIPALLTLFGDRLLRPSPFMRVPVLGKMMKVVGDSSSETGIFSKLAHAVHGRPWSVMLIVTAILLLMASPVRNLELRNNFTDYIPKGSPTETAFQTIQSDYPELATPAIQAVVDAPVDSDEVDGYANQVRELPDVGEVTVSELEGHEGMALIDVHVDAEDQAGGEVTQLVHDMRDFDDGAAQAWVGGSAANQLDFRTMVTDDLPLALGVVAAAVMVLLFLMTGSVIVPIKALIINGLSIIAALGVTTAIFQNGWLGVPQSPGLETFIVVCMIAFGFGLAMDYEVFLLARIKEYWDAGESNDQAVAKGLQRSGRIITSAAAIVIAVFIGFAMGDMIAIKQIGVGLAIMVATDATLTRMLLVPATMTVMGKWNWWAPKPLAKLSEKIGLRE